ncbi:MAG: hypothetical protein NTX56_14615, partial [Proteobacteria bacterium]|nr:hypothetical protein [Pseudomonadota bacterium]
AKRLLRRFALAYCAAILLLTKAISGGLAERNRPRQVPRTAISSPQNCATPVRCRALIISDTRKIYLLECPKNIQTFGTCSAQSGAFKS